MTQVEVLGTSIKGVTSKEVLNLLDDYVVAKADVYVCFCEAHLSVQGIWDSDVRRALDKAACVLPDGVSMTLGARVLGTPLPERITGPATMLAYMRHGVDVRRRHF